MTATVIILLLSCSLPVFTAAQKEDCIGTYQELKDSLRNNGTDNVLNLLNTFYPSKEVQVHYVRVVYSYSSLVGNTTSVTLYWTDTALLATIDYDLLKALTFRIADLTDEKLSVFISPFCNDTDEIELLDTLTIWVSIIIIYIMS